MPELVLGLAADAVGLWEQAESELDAGLLPPPFWAFAWPGGQALARHLLDHPHLVAGRRVLDVACGSGLVGLAAARAGAAGVLAVDCDEFAVAAARRNGARNGLRLRVRRRDAGDLPPPFPGQLVTAGDVFYDREMAAVMLAALENQRSHGATVLIGDPYRSYLPRERLDPLATYDVPVDPEVEGMAVKRTLVARLAPPRG